MPAPRPSNLSGLLRRMGARITRLENGRGKFGAWELCTDEAGHLVAVHRVSGQVRRVATVPGYPDADAGAAGSTVHERSEEI